VLDRLPNALLRAEGAAVLVAAVALYVDGDHSWLLFAVLLLAPDLGMIGYASGPRAGAAAYDALHFEAVPLLLALVGHLSGSGAAVAVGLVWLAHIGMDRAIGYGLKYPTHFKDTHLQRV
jgi:Domain of unknown function (DUF4260)